jgi:hypothetical protein
MKRKKLHQASQLFQYAFTFPLCLSASVVKINQ